MAGGWVLFCFVLFFGVSLAQCSAFDYATACNSTTVIEKNGTWVEEQQLTTTPNCYSVQYDPNGLPGKLIRVAVKSTDYTNANYHNLCYSIVPADNDLALGACTCLTNTLEDDDFDLLCYGGSTWPATYFSNSELHVVVGCSADNDTSCTVEYELYVDWVVGGDDSACTKDGIASDYILLIGLAVGIAALIVGIVLGIFAFFVFKRIKGPKQDMRIYEEA